MVNVINVMTLMKSTARCSLLQSLFQNRLLKYMGCNPGLKFSNNTEGLGVKLQSYLKHPDSIYGYRM